MIPIFFSNRKLFETRSRARENISCFFLEHFSNVEVQIRLLCIYSESKPVLLGRSVQGILKKAVSNPSLAKLDGMSEVGAVSEAGGTISEVWQRRLLVFIGEEI
jgi:hypothetical protein